MDLATATDDYMAWCILHNSFADERAKAANHERPMDFQRLHKSLCRHYYEQERRLKHIADLQLQCAAKMKRVHKPSKTMQETVKDDLWQLHWENFGLLRNDKCFTIPGAGSEFQVTGFLLHAPFGMLLWEWLSAQFWVEDSAGMSLAELYTLFCLHTGWVVPVNISAIPDEQRPMELRTGPQARVWSHETVWSSLILKCESFSAQISTFRKILAAVFKQQGITWSVQPLTSIRIFGYRLVTSSLTMRPVSSLDGSAINCMLRLQAGAAWRSFLSRGFSVPKQPVAAPCAAPDVAAVFRSWKNASR